VIVINTYDLYKRPRLLIDLDLKYIEEMVKNGTSLSKIAKTYKVCSSTLRRRIIETKGNQYYADLIKPKNEKERNKKEKIETNMKYLREKIEPLSKKEKKEKALVELRINPTKEIILKQHEKYHNFNLDEAIKSIEILHKKLYIVNTSRGNNIVAAASVYVQSKNKTLEPKITQKIVSKMFSVTIPPVRNVFKIIKKTPKEIYNLTKEENLNRNLK